MKHAVTAVHLLLLGMLLALAGCNSGQEDNEAAPAPVVEERPPETQAPAPAEPAAGEDAKPEIVEESAAVATEAPDEDQSIVLARAGQSADQEWKFSEGDEFHRLVPTQPTVGGPSETRTFSLPFAAFRAGVENLPGGLRHIRRIGQTAGALPLDRGQRVTRLVRRRKTGFEQRAR